MFVIDFEHIQYEQKLFGVVDLCSLFISVCIVILYTLR